ncbi:hypothetical protein ACFSAG_04960 [Sphingorhabdus buctiana]|jgi:hypothetical protein|uniref:Uncharacterized protein n=1 Tax=Sphingorhabdus buctiana TaxID=1508805 RepID=A0ABW4MBW1_9SPHN
MLHLFFDKQPWFRAKRYGYGAGLPMKWQGWVLMLAHIALIMGLGISIGDRPEVALPLLLLAGFAPLPIYAAKTEGGWRWRWGD